MPGRIIRDEDVEQGTDDNLIKFTFSFSIDYEWGMTSTLPTKLT